MTLALPRLDAARQRLADTTLAFVGGQGKSGTTWAERLIDAHPDAACLGEGHFAEGLGRGLYQALDQYNRGVAANNARFPELEDFPGIAADDAADLVRAALLLQFARIAARNPDATVVAVRTPSELTWLRELAAAFPHARFVHMLRDPRDVAVSLWWHGERLTPGSMQRQHGSLARLASALAPDWARHVQHVRDAARTVDVPLHELRYESLHASPEATSADLFDFLSLRNDAATVQATLEAASFGSLSGRSAGTEDRGSHFRSGTAGGWRTQLPHDIARTWPEPTRDLLASLDYALD